MIGGWDSSKNQSARAFRVCRVIRTDRQESIQHTSWNQVLLCLTAGLFSQVMNPSSASLQKLCKQEKPTGNGSGEVERKTRDVERSWFSWMIMSGSIRSTRLPPGRPVQGPRLPAESWEVSTCPKIYCSGKRKWHEDTDTGIWGWQMIGNTLTSVRQKPKFGSGWKRNKMKVFCNSQGGFVVLF